jgi:hypothetical protein
MDRQSINGFKIASNAIRWIADRDDEFLGCIILVQDRDLVEDLIKSPSFFTFIEC